MCGVIKSLETDSATLQDTDGGGNHRGDGVEKGGEGSGTEGTGGQGAEAGAGAGAGAGTGSAWHGNVLLDERGAAEVRLPAGFVGEVRLLFFVCWCCCCCSCFKFSRFYRSAATANVLLFVVGIVLTLRSVAAAAGPRKDVVAGPPTPCGSFFIAVVGGVVVVGGGLGFGGRCTPLLTRSSNLDRAHWALHRCHPFCAALTSVVLVRCRVRRAGFSRRRG